MRNVFFATFLLGGILPAGSEPVGLPWPMHVVDASSRGADGVRLGDLNRDGLPDIVTGWEEGGLTRVYLHPGYKLVKAPWPRSTVGKTPNSEDAVFADLDGDGTLEVLTACEGRTRHILIHWAPEHTAQWSLDTRWVQTVLPASAAPPRQWMFLRPSQVDGQHGVDVWAGAKGKGAQIGWFQAPADPRDVQGYRWHPISEAGWIMSLWLRDMDGDGDEDVVVTDRKGAKRGARWLEHPGVGAVDGKWTSHAIGDTGEEVMFMVLADLDGDGLEDAVVPVKNGNILWLRRTHPDGRQWTTHSIKVGGYTGTPKAVAVTDLNGDGRADIVLTCEHAEGRHGVIGLLQPVDTGKGAWHLRTISGAERGIKFDRIELVDLDGDGDPDVLTCEEREGGRGLGVIWYENPGTLP